MTTTFNTNQARLRFSKRRGSALLIVVGTLALIAVFAAIYISIGHNDQRVAQSVKNRQVIADTSGTVADHILGVIGSDRLDFTVQHTDVGTGIFTVKEVTDAPYTDWTMLSESNDQWRRFNPSGRHWLAGGTALGDFRVASDPWLASTSPTYLGNPGQPGAAATDLRPFGSLIQTVTPSSYIADTYSSGFLDKRDWLQISNLAPDGRFVNLFNLRPNTAQSNGFGDANVGGFDSEPGTGTFVRPSDGRLVRRMSEYLSLWKTESGTGVVDPSTRIQAFDPAIEGIWLPGRNSPEPGHGIGDVSNVPAVWTMYQRFAFQPINQPFITVNRNGIESTWADPDFAPYQWADADGDGMTDARWIELTSAQEVRSLSTNTRNDIERLYDAGRARVFIAARVVDLSSMVNVNTALDQLEVPSASSSDEVPIGATPGDVDLRRWLSLADVGQNYSIAPFSGLSPSNFHKPVLTLSNNMPFDTDYKWYRNYTDPTTASPTIEIEPSSNALVIGRYSYDAIKRGIEVGNTLDERYFAWPPEIREVNNRATPLVLPTPTNFTDDGMNPTSDDFTSAGAAYRLNQFHQDPVIPTGDPMTALQRMEWYMNLGRLSPFDTQQDQNGYAAGALYGKDDQFELLAFHGLNDPANVSRLEKATIGRMPSIFGQNQRGLSPMLSNRPLSLDRDRHGFVDEDGYASGYRIVAPSEDRVINGGVSKESMAFFSASPRRLLTTVSGAVHLKPGPSATPNPEAAPSLASALSSPTALFEMSSKALAGELGPLQLGLTLATMDQAFEQSPTNFRDLETATLFYGHRGPELALRIAAHTAVNMKDLSDSDTDPEVATLIVDNSRRQEFDNTTNFPETDAAIDPTNRWYSDFPGVALENEFDVGQDNLPGTTGTPHLADENRRAVNVYGIEPMPILTETVSFYVYHDKSESAGGDVDFVPTLRPRRVPGEPLIRIEPGEQPKITINPNTNSTAPDSDCIMQGIAFQLHNPWDAPISLGGNGVSARAPLTRLRDPLNANQVDTSANYQFDYYIEWNGYFYKLAQYIQYYPPSTNPSDFRSMDSTDLGVSNPAIDNPAVGSGDGLPLDPSVYPDYVGRNVVLAPGETRVFYAIADSSFDSTTDPLLPEWTLDKKWRLALGAYSQLPPQYSDAVLYDAADGDGIPDGFDGRGWTGPAKEWLQRQLRPGGSLPVQIHPMNPQTGQYADTTYNDFLNTPMDHTAFDQLASATGRQDPAEVRLWRKIVTPAEETRDAAFTNGTSENLLHNDMLVDRMSLLSGVATPVVLSGLNNEVLKTASFAEDYPDTGPEFAYGARNDNSGYTVVQWASTSRRDSDNEDVPGVGQVKEWMLSSRATPTASLVSATDEIQAIGGDIASLDNEDFLDAGGDLDQVQQTGTVKTDYETHLSLGNMLAESFSQSVFVTADLPPHLKSDLNTSASGNGDLGSMEKYNRDTDGLWAHPLGITLHEAGNFDQVNLRPELLTSARNFKNAPRLADLLLAWGIGPAYAPTAAGSLNDPNASYYPTEWMTVTEAMAIALGYVNPDPNPAVASVDNIWANTFDANERLFDNGHLAIDNYVAYYNTDTTEVVPDFDVAADVRRGTGVPMALGLLDQARPIGPLVSSSNILTTPTYGLININTAPVEVLRLLPGLSPLLTRYYPNNTATTKEVEWWGGRIDHLALDLPNLSTPDRTPDVAASLVGYRDRMYVQPRFRSLTVASQDSDPLNFAPANLGDLNPLDNTFSHAANLVNEIPIAPPLSDNDHRDRQTIVGIDGIRATPGFGSLGEVLAVTLSPEARGASGGSLGVLHPQLSIQQFATDQLNLDGISDTEVAYDPQLFNGEVNGETFDDYAERLAIANGILNTISVRSDYYAVWFVVHAYQESDVANLQPEDPLVPSVAKRYVMVVDRTNVVKPGDTPKIVFLREVPM